MVLQTGVEMVTIRNDGGRMNTVFKFWYQSWIALAVGSAVVMVQLLVDRDQPAVGAWGRRLALVTSVLAASVTVAFWWLATPARLDDRISDGGLRLDGERYLSADVVVATDDDMFSPSSDLPLVEWLRGGVEGIRVIAEAPGDDYRWSSRMSALTGLSTPIGWPYHESQQRRIYGATIERRRHDMTALYTSSDPVEVAAILERYDIEYVVFGTRERQLASSGSALQDHACLDTVFTGDGEDRDLWIARVDAECVSRVRRTGR